MVRRTTSAIVPSGNHDLRPRPLAILPTPATPWASKLRAYTAPTVLVVDDVGLLPMERGGAAAFFHVVNTRYERGHPTLVTTNRGLPEWAEVFGDAVVAAAILDRLMHDAVVFNIKGPSWRMREHHALEQAATGPDLDPDPGRRCR